MALRELGETLDVHGGGRDLVFPHHECETAQSETVTGEPFVRHWFHIGLVGLDGTKMSKSLGNLVFVDDLLARADAAAIRVALLAHHYRFDWEWHDHDLDVGLARVARWRAASGVDDGRSLAIVRERLDDDLDTPGALAGLDELAAAGLSVREGAALLGVSL